MKLDKECIACLVSRAEFEADLSTKDKKIARNCVFEFVKLLSTKNIDKEVASEIGTARSRLVAKLTNQNDAYKEIKELSHKIAFSLLPMIKKRIESAKNPDYELIKILVAGNALDFGVENYTVDLDNFSVQFEKELTIPFGCDQRKKLFEEINSASTILYLLDNCGEDVFDKLFVDRLLDKGKTVYTGAKGINIINDSTVEDAKELGFPNIISVGHSVGINFETADPIFKELFCSVDLVIAKGMASYEKITDLESIRSKPLFYILKAKCLPVARHAGVSLGEFVVKKAS